MLRFARRTQLLFTIVKAIVAASFHISCISGYVPPFKHANSFECASLASVTDVHQLVSRSNRNASSSVFWLSSCTYMFSAALCLTCASHTRSPIERITLPLDRQVLWNGIKKSAYSWEWTDEEANEQLLSSCANQWNTLGQATQNLNGSVELPDTAKIVYLHFQQACRSTCVHHFCQFNT